MTSKNFMSSVSFNIFIICFRIFSWTFINHLHVFCCCVGKLLNQWTIISLVWFLDPGWTDGKESGCSADGSTEANPMGWPRGILDHLFLIVDLMDACFTDGICLKDLTVL
jgi:hypothetical protein